MTDTKGNLEADPDLRDNENVPLPEQRVTFEADVSARLAMPNYRTAIDEYITAEVLPHVPDAWADYDKSRPNPRWDADPSPLRCQALLQPGPPRCGNVGREQPTRSSEHGDTRHLSRSS